MWILRLLRWIHLRSFLGGDWQCWFGQRQHETEEQNCHFRPPVITVRTLEWLLSSVNQLMILQFAVFNLKKVNQISRKKLSLSVIKYFFSFPKYHYKFFVHRLATESTLGSLEPFSCVCCLVFHQVSAKSQVFSVKYQVNVHIQKYIFRMVAFFWISLTLWSLHMAYKEIYLLAGIKDFSTVGTGVLSSQFMNQLHVRPQAHLEINILSDPWAQSVGSTCLYVRLEWFWD